MWDGARTGPLKPAKKKKKYSQSHVWRYLAFESDDQGQVMDYQIKLVRKLCLKAFTTK